MQNIIHPSLPIKISTGIFIVFFILFLVPPMLSASEDINTLHADLVDLLNDKAFQSAHIGIAVQSVNKDTYLFRYNENKRFLSASNMKLYTSAAALLSLSPDFMYETKLVTDGIVSQGVLRGNLIIIASGDPTISGHFNNNNPTQIFENWADILIQKGILKIEGDIIVDNSLFNDNPFGAGWHWDDMVNCYSAPKDAFSFNNNCIALIISPGNEINTPALIEIEPRTGYVLISGNIATTGRDSQASVRTEYVDNSNRITVTGNIPLDHRKITKYMAIKKPADFGAYVFRETLVNKGLEVNGNIFCSRGNCNLIKDPSSLNTGRGAASLTTLAVYFSPKLSEIIKVVNKISNNLYAENLLLTIAKEERKKTNSEEATLAVREILKKAGVVTEGLYMADGSGLSRFNLITPHETVQLLLTMAHSPYRDAFYSSLAVTGEEGTLRNRPRETSNAAPFNVRAKTGTMAHVRNLSGYITTKSGELLAFSFLCNNHSSPNAVIDNLFDKLLEKLGRLPSPTSD